jgi:hypothetical protein
MAFHQGGAMPSVRRARFLFAAVALAALATAPDASAAGPMVLKFPRFTVPAHSDREVCTFVRLPRRRAFDSGGFEIVNLGVNPEFVSHHFLMYTYVGTNADGFPARGQIVDSKACLDFGPTDRNQRILIGGSQSPRSRQRLPRGLAQHIEPPGEGQPIGIILNTHWINGSDRPRDASVKIRIFPARRGLRRYMQPIFEATASGFLSIPPGKMRTATWSWGPGALNLAGAFGGAANPEGAACVAMVTAHMHKRGRLFTADFIGLNRPRIPLLATDDYADPPQAIFDGQAGRPGPLLVRPGERIEYACTHANGTDDVSLKLGCEESPGETPGKSIAEVVLSGRGLFSGTPKDCMSDADCCPAGGPCADHSGRQLTGKCVPANLVFGFTSNDEMCILPGAYYDANPSAPAGAECDLARMPLLKRK